MSTTVQRPGATRCVPLRWNQFTVRSLLALMVVVSLAVSWLAVKLNAARQQREAVRLICEHGCVSYDDEREGSAPSCAAVPTWLRQILGRDFFANVVTAYLVQGDRIKFIARLPHVQFVSCLTPPEKPDDLRLLAGLPELTGLLLESPSWTDADVSAVQSLVHLQTLTLDTTRVTDAGMENLAPLTNLRELVLIEDAQVTDKGLENLRGMTKLRVLGLTGAAITDAGLAGLKGHSQLEELDLYGTKVTDAGLEELPGFAALKRLALSDEIITPHAVDQIRERLPNAKIDYQHRDESWSRNPR